MKDLYKQISDISRNTNKIKIYKGNPENGKIICQTMNIFHNKDICQVVENFVCIIVDDWIRILGQGDANINGITHYNTYQGRLKKYPTMLFIATDVLGGLFAVNIDNEDENEDLVWYFAPDTLEWECLNINYTDFVFWCIKGNADIFYKPFRWKNWKMDVKNIPPNKAFSVYPFLCSEECDIEKASKRIVSVDEVINVNFELAKQL